MHRRNDVVTRDASSGTMVPAARRDERRSFGIRRKMRLRLNRAVYRLSVGLRVVARRRGFTSIARTATSFRILTGCCPLRTPPFNSAPNSNRNEQLAAEQVPT